MKKKILVLTFILILCLSTYAYGIDIIIDHQIVYFNEQSGFPFIDNNGRTQVPLRITMEDYGADVSWNDYTKTALIKKDKVTVEIPIGKNYIVVNNQKIDTDTSALVKDGRTYLPIRAVIEAFEGKVEWTDNRVMITPKDNNIYTKEFLDDLVNNTECEKRILDFRSSKNPRRNGLLKTEGKYFDMYYPNDDYGKETAELLAPHMDKVYMMLCDIYGMQAKVEVHLIHYEDAMLLKEGEEGKIRQIENVTMVFLEPGNDANGNNLAEFVHEINHCFFSQVNGPSNNTMWLNEANAKMIASLYIQDNYNGKVEQWSFYDKLHLLLKSYLPEYKKVMNLNYTDTYLREERAYYAASGEKRVAQIYGMYVWSYIYNHHSLDEYKMFLRNLGNEDVIDKLEELLDMNSQEITEMINKDIFK